MSYLWKGFWFILGNLYADLSILVVLAIGFICLKLYSDWDYKKGKAK